MRVFIDKDNGDYVEAKTDGAGNVNLSIRTKKDTNASIIITAKLNDQVLEKLITNLVILKSKVVNEK